MPDDNVNKNLSLKERSWICPECGSINDRDLNAAKNILRRGIYELESKRKTSQEAVYAIIQEFFPFMDWSMPSLI